MQSPEALNDPRLQERFEEINDIVSRRNEFLRELYRLIQIQKDSAYDFTNDEGLQFFLERFDLTKDGSIKNLDDGEVYSETGQPLQLPEASLTPIGSGEISTRKTPSPWTPLPHPELSREHTRSPRSAGLNSLHSVTRNEFKQMEESDEEHDELDLIGSFAMEERKFLLESKSRENAAILAATPELISEQNTKDNKSSPFDHRPLVEIRPPQSEDERVDGTATVILQSEPIPEEDQSMDESEVAVEPKLLPDPGRDVLPDEDVSKVVEVASDARSLDQETVPMDVDKDDETAKEDAVLDVIAPAVIETETAPSTQESKYIPIRIPLPPSTQEEVLIPVPQKLTQDPQYDIDFNLELGQTAQNASAEPGQAFDPNYSLPPITILPTDFTRKFKSTKRKRDREGKKDKEDGLPMSFNRWGAIVKANPVWKKVSRANKCLSTREWGVAMAELKLMRVIDRIDSLKQSGRWSFRQPKKQRAIGNLLKTHWDYLMDEMRWMRIDFREERRWKMALAYHLSTAVLEWHFAKTPEERVRSGITVKWRFVKPVAFKQIEMVDSERRHIPQTELTQNRALSIDYESDEQDEEELKDTENVIDPLEPAAMIEDVLLDAEDIRFKKEDDDLSSAQLLQEIKEDYEFADNLAFPAEVGGEQSFDQLQGLRSFSSNPILGSSKSSSQSTNGDSDVLGKIKLPKPLLTSIREQIVYGEDANSFIELNNIRSVTSNLGGDDLHSFDSLDINMLFSDLQPLDLFDAPSSATLKDGAKKNEKRTEDTSHTKLYPTGRFMFVKPTLIGPLQPSKRWSGDKWQPMNRMPVAPDYDYYSRLSEDVTNELFDGKSGNPSSNIALLKDKDSRKRVAVENTWIPSDDALLRTLVDKYSTNWQLVAECFNSSLHSTFRDKRTPVECSERWKDRWGSERKHTAPEVFQSSLTEETSASVNSNQMTTRGVKRLASSNIHLPTLGGNSEIESKKRLRHYNFFNSMKSVYQKRNASLKSNSSQRKAPGIHETHHQFNKLPKLSPAELSRMKFERDARDSQEIGAGRKHEDIVRQKLMREQQVQRSLQTGQTPPQPQPQPQQQPQQQSVQQPQPQQSVQSAQASPLQQPQQLSVQQLAQLQLQVQQQQQAQNQRSNLPPVVLPSRSTRLTAPVNARTVNQQGQLLQQARLQVPMQMQGANLAQIAGNTSVHAAAGSAFYSLPPNLTQEQFLMLIQSAQQQQLQQGQ